MRASYSFCKRPVTVYNPVWDAAGALHLRRCVLPRAFLAPGRRFGHGSAYAGSGLTGATSKEEFLLVVPLGAPAECVKESGPLGGDTGPGAGAGADGTGRGEALWALDSEYRFVPGVAFAALADKAGCFTLTRGTRVFDGIGPVVDGEEAWAGFIPTLADGVYEIGRAALRRGPDGRAVHVEGGAL